MLPKSRLAILLFVASCATASVGPTAVEDSRRRRAAPDSSARLAEGVLQFSRSATEALSDEVASPPASNTYSHQRLLGPRKRLGEPQVQLASTNAHSALSSTDCSGWLSFALNTVSPLHEAVLQSQRRLGEHNQVYSEDFALREGRRPWPRAFVVARYLRSDHAKATGFEPVANFESLQPGDIGAYAMGRYAKPSDENRPKPRDTGHVFVVAGPPSVVDPATEGYDGRGTLRKDAVKVIAVPVIDSSATVHFEPDSRKSEEGRYVPPKFRPHARARAGGVGAGTIWFALSDEGRVLQRRLGPQQKYRPVLARAARMRGRISLDEPVLDGGDALVVRVFENSPSEFDGVQYGDSPVHLTGPGGLRLANGRIVLKGENDFTGGVTVQAAEVIAASPTALGAGNVVVRGGSMTLQEPAIAESASLQLAEDLPEGSIRLEFRGRNVVRALQIGDRLHRCGTWGGPESKAMFIDPVFAGSGVLELTDQPLEACATLEDERSRRRPTRRASSKARSGQL